MNLQQGSESSYADLDVGPDGSIYTSQVSRSAEILRFGVSGENFRRVDTIPNPILVEPPLHLPDGRTLLTVVMAGNRRLVIAAPGKDSTPFVEGDEETGTPAALLDRDRVAFMIGRDKDRRIAIASLDSGRILRRLQGVQAGGISAMTASPDGKEIYFVESGIVWSIPTEDGTPQKIHVGDGVAAAPDGKSLTIQLARVGKVEWLRVDVGSGRAQPIAVKEAAIFPIATPPGPNAVGPDGRILMAINVTDSWFYPPAIFDPTTGKIQRIPIRYDADMFTPGWSADGKIIAVGHTMESALWRFRPTR
jgi:Tol biopolymer transport system component